MSGLMIVTAEPTGRAGGRKAFGIIPSWAKMSGLYAHPWM